jgi:hypothetical protein
MPDKLPPITPSDRTKAHRLRALLRKGDELPPDDTAWLSDYQVRQEESRGASRTHKVSFTEESAEAAGTGDAAAIAAAQFAPALAREEGRRIDYLIASANQATNIGLGAVREAHKMILEMAKQIMERNASLEEVHLAMLDTVRDSHIARTNAEAEIIRREAEDSGKDGEGGINGMVQELMPIIIQELTTRAAAKKG